MADYLVTGALGNVGSRVVEELLARGRSVRAADMSLDALEERFGDRAEPARLDFNDEFTFAEALDGARRVFLIRPPAIARVGSTLNRFIDHAARNRTETVVFSSVAGADTNTIVPHHRVETHLRTSGIPWTFLRPGFFAQNIGSAYRRDIIENGRIYVTAGEGRIAFIDARDIAAVAALALIDPSHQGAAYHLTGPQAVTFHQVASILTNQLGRAIAYQPATIPGYYSHLKRQGLITPHALIQTILHAGLRRGDAEPVTNTVETLLGRPPIPLQTYVADHLHLWAA